jgi:hypothetical protein
MKRRIGWVQCESGKLHDARPRIKDATRPHTVAEDPAASEVVGLHDGKVEREFPRRRRLAATALGSVVT